ncbi:MAG: TrkA C-terminal domain-containing protein [Halarchaeum sp.]
MELAVDRNAPIAGFTLSEANERGLLDDDLLVIAIERDDEILTPRGHTQIRPDDLVTVFTRKGASEAAIEIFIG